LIITGRVIEAKKTHETIKMEMPSSDPDEVKDDFFLDFFFEQMNDKLTLITSKTLELVWVRLPSNGYKIYT